MSSNKYKVDLARVFRMHGYLLPLNENEILALEANMKISKETPPYWDNPTEILKRGKRQTSSLSQPILDSDTVSNLAMAARDGKGITDEIRRKMNHDRKNSGN